MTQDPTGLNLRGAVDLSSLGRPSPTPQAGAGASAAPEGLVVEVTAETFGELVQRSSQVPVVVDLYSARSAASTQLSPALQQLAIQYGGQFLLARVDGDANPQIPQAVGAQQLPMTFAILAGQPVPLFQGVASAEQIKGVLDELLRVAAENGVTGTVDLGEPTEEPEEAEEPPLPPHLQAAYDAIESGELEQAADGLADVVTNNPGDAEAKTLLTQVELLRRVDGIDPAAALAAAQESPGDVDAQLLAADVEVSAGQPGAAYARLLGVVRTTFGDGREQARQRLVDLFLLAPPDDAAVSKARRDLAIALY